MERPNITSGEADLSAREVVGVLDSVQGTFDRAQLGLKQATAGETVLLDDL